MCDVVCIGTSKRVITARPIQHRVETWYPGVVKLVTGSTSFADIDLRQAAKLVELFRTSEAREV